VPSPSAMDVEHLSIIRASVRAFMERIASSFKDIQLLLDIAPQVHEGARPFFASHVQVETLDIDERSVSTYIADICKTNSFIPNGRFDAIICTEVLEHTIQPFDAMEEMYRLLSPGGHLFLTVPFNFRIHGPLPDCWRFTEHGLRSLLRRFEVIELLAVETSDRPLMPIHYTVIAKKPFGL
jgi:SAM-dependent methyltransferase